MGRTQRAPPPAQPKPQPRPSPLQQLHISQKHNLRVEALLGSEIFQVHGVLTPEECQRFIATAEGIGFAHQSSRGPRFGEALRKNGRIQVQDDVLAERLWRATTLDRVCARLAVGKKRPAGLNPNIRLYRYTKGQHFGPHIDEAVQLGGGAVTGYTLLIYLSGGLAGGETMFHGDRGELLASVAPAAGLALLHAHGDDCLEHEAAAVERGVKYILRSDVVFA